MNGITKVGRSTVNRNGFDGLIPRWLSFLVGMSCFAVLAASVGTQNSSAAGVGGADDADRRPSPRRELWVSQQRDSKISILSFPYGELLHEFALPGSEPHLITFHSGGYAYVSGMGNGTLSIVEAGSRRLVQTLSFGPTLCHQGKVSPDGTTMLVTLLSTQTLHRVAVDEAHQSWTPDGSVSFAALGKTPICSVFRADSKRAYVSMLPDGIAIVDVPSLKILGALATDGFVACGMIKPSEHASHAVVAAGGGGGHIYTLDMSNDVLLDRGTLGAADWHSFNMNREESLGFGSSPSSDEVVLADLTTNPVTNLGTLPLQPLPGLGNNQPDSLGGGTPIVAGTLAVGLRAAGQVALVDSQTLEVEFVKITEPSPPGTFNPMTCQGCSVHGVSVRPKARK